MQVPGNNTSNLKIITNSMRKCRDNKLQRSVETLQGSELSIQPPIAYRHLLYTKLKRYVDTN